ncbi:MAG: dephospho-CoA kinase [Chthoniobacterales bacterium]|nr:dephospho-CoA kinase [Chthoniobacterales bacterium]
MSTRCTVIGITGGISTGKSTFSQLLRERTGAALFDADRAARLLVDEDAEVREMVRAQFGAEIFSAAGDLNRAALRAIVFAEPEKKRALEQILHPRIRLQWATAANQSHQTGALFLADIPLLYETNGENLCDAIVVVACAQAIQQDRLMRRARLSPAQAMAMIASQMPLSQKISRADHVVWNNGPVAVLEAQADTLSRRWR